MIGRGGRTGRGGAAFLSVAALVAGLAVAVPTGRARAAEEAPYDDQLARLAEILGALHHLRPLCGASGEAQTWRDQMTAILDAEQPSRERRRRFVERFNRSWRAISSVHRACSPAARALAERWRLEGEALGRDLLRRWGRS